MVLPYSIEVLAYTLDYFALYLILMFGVNYIVQGRKNDSEVVRRYSFGLGLFFISIAGSSLLYMVDLTSRQLFNAGRIFPSQAEYEAMGYFFDSLHPQFYFIVILAFLLLSLSFLMNPLEKYIITGTKGILSKLCLIFFPLPFVVRILELVTLPHEGSLLYWIYFGIYGCCWLIIVFSALALIGVYIKMAVTGAGDVRKRSLGIVFGILLWLVSIFVKPTFFKSLDDYGYFFWILPALQIFMTQLFVYGFGVNLSTHQTEVKYLYQHWLFKTLIFGLIGWAAFYFSILFWDTQDLLLSMYWSTTGNIENYGVFMDQSWFSGEPFGGQDFTYIMAIIAVLLYFASYLKPFEAKLLPIRKYCGFIIVVLLAVTIGSSRVGKLIFARARPGDVMGGENTFSSLLMFGSYPIEDAFSHGSFPSGHTTTAMGLIALAFIAIKTHKSWVIAPLFVITILWAVALSVGRVMYRAHYPGDTLWAIIFCLVLTIWVYFSLLKIPEQEDGTFTISAKFGELRIGIWMLIVEAGFAVMVVGMRYTVIDFLWYWPVAIGVGLVIMWIGWQRVRALTKQ